MRVMEDEVRRLEHLIAMHRQLSDMRLRTTMWNYDGVMLMREPQLGDPLSQEVLTRTAGRSLVWTQDMLDEVWRLGS